MPAVSAPARIAALISLACCGCAAAQNIGMPPGATRWIEVKGNWVAADICCDDAVGGEGSIPVPSPNYVGDPARLSNGARVYANADCTANRMRDCYYMINTDSVFMYNSMVDTYTITGPAGTNGQPVSARLQFHGVGTLFVGQTVVLNGTGRHIGLSSIELEVGTWNPDTNPTVNEQFRVTAFDPTFAVTTSIPLSNYGTSTPTLPFDLTVDRTISRTVGTPFTIAYGFNAGSHGLGNTTAAATPSDSQYAVATIQWILPVGYHITSTLGWTDPNSPTCPADFNHDSTFDLFDYLDFVAAFTAGTPDADFNGDALVDFFDYLDYVDAFSVGC